MTNMKFLLLLLSFTLFVGYSKAEQQITKLKNKPTDRHKGIYLDQNCCLRLKIQYKNDIMAAIEIN